MKLSDPMRERIMVQLDMSEFISCTQCQGVMVLEDRGEVLDSVDVMSLFGYRCLTCGHEEGTTTGRMQNFKSFPLEERLEVQHT